MYDGTNSSSSMAPAHEPEWITVQAHALKVAPNIRRHIAQKDIEEMAASMLEHGVLQPITVRLRDGEPEVCYGQKRTQSLLLAITLAEEQSLPPKNPQRFTSRADELTLVQCILKDLSDRDLLEHQFIENFHRGDVNPLDEAGAFAQMLALQEDGKPVYSRASLAQRLGIRSASYITERMYVLRAPESLVKAWERAEVTVTHLELVGSVPGVKQREAAAKAVLKPEMQTGPLNVADTKAYLQANCRVSLAKCGFDLKDGTLVAVEWEGEVRLKGGACVDCPHLTGNMPELEGQVTQGRGTSGGRGVSSGQAANVCCHVACFREKQNAVWRKTKRRREEEGGRVWDVDEASKVFDEAGRLRVDKGLVDLGGTPLPDELGHYNVSDAPEWSTLLQDTSAMQEAIMARHPQTQRLYWLLERERAIELATENGHGDVFRGRKGQRGKGQEKRGKGEESGKGQGTGDKGSEDREEHEHGQEQDDDFNEMGVDPMVRMAKVESMTLRLMMEKLHDGVHQSPDFLAKVGQFSLRQALVLVPHEGLTWVARLLNADAHTELDHEGVWELLQLRLMPEEGNGKVTDPQDAARWLVLLLVAGELGVNEVDLQCISDTLGGICEALGVDVEDLMQMAERTVPGGESEEDGEDGEKGREGGAESGPGDGQAGGLTPAVGRDAQPPGDAPEVLPQVDTDFHCDGCEALILVPAMHVLAVADMKDGEFKCTSCGGEWVARKAGKGKGKGRK